MADYTPLYLPGDAYTTTASAAISGGQLCAVTGADTVGPTSAAGPAYIGVALFDAPSGGRVTLALGKVIHETTAAATVTAAQTLEAAASGQVTPHTNGTNDTNIVGVAMSSAASGAKVRWATK